MTGNDITRKYREGMKQHHHFKTDIKGPPDDGHQANAPANIGCYNGRLKIQCRAVNQDPECIKIDEEGKTNNW